MSDTHLHALSAAEADALTLRAEALNLFRARYRHNPQSERAMVGALRRLARTFSNEKLDEATFPWEVLVDEDLSATMWSTVAAGYARRTATKDASALRIMLHFCRRVGLLTHEEYHHARGFEAKGGQERPPAGHYLDEDDIGRIITECWNGAGGETTRLRDTALTLCLASTGARGDELTGVRLDCTHLAEQRLWLPRTKSGKPRSAWLHPESVHAVGRWLDVRGHEPGALFVPLSRTGPLHHRGELSTHQVWKIVRNRARAAGYDGITPHDLRRFVISTLLQRGVDLAMVPRSSGTRTRPRPPATTCARHPAARGGREIAAARPAVSIAPSRRKRQPSGSASPRPRPAWGTSAHSAGHLRRPQRPTLAPVRCGAVPGQRAPMHAQAPPGRLSARRMVARSAGVRPTRGSGASNVARMSRPASHSAMTSRRVTDRPPR